MRFPRVLSLLLLLLAACREPQPQRLVITTGELPEGHLGTPYHATLEASGGKGPLSWTRLSGTLPVGLELAADGVISGTASVVETASFTVQVTDGGQRVSRELTLRFHPALQLSVDSLPPVTEGMTWLAAPGTPVRLTAAGGKPPFTYTVRGLPMGLGVDTQTGILFGIPAQGTAGSHTVTVSVSDAAGGAAGHDLPLTVLAASPLSATGTVSRPPQGSPITHDLTVFTLDSGRRPLRGIGVRVRKNGVEYNPPRQALSDAQGKVHFTGLGLNGTTDTVDITANGRDLYNVTLAQVNAALVTLVMSPRPVLLPRYDAVSAYDTDTHRMILTGGYNAYGKRGCVNDVIELADAANNTWLETVPPGMPGAPVIVGGSAAYAGGVMVVFGGFDCLTAQNILDTWEYVPATRTWNRLSVEGPGALHLAAMTRDDTGERVLLFGGYSPRVNAVNAETWVYTPATDSWALRTPTGSVPAARAGAAAAFDTLSGEMVVCGGYGQEGELYADCNAYSPADNSWKPMVSLPAPRTQARMAFNPGSGELYLFGGIRDGQELSDLLAFRNGSWVTLTPDGAAGAPPLRYGQSLQFDTASGLLVLVGGASPTENQILGDVWTYSPADGQWRWRNAPPPPEKGLRLTGTLTSDAMVEQYNIPVSVSFRGSSGYAREGALLMQNGTARYELDDVPPNETLSITAYLQDTTTFPSVLSSYVMATTGPITQDTTFDLVLPSGPLPVITTTVSVIPPATWTAVSSLSGVPYVRVPAGSRFSNGIALGNRAARSIQYDTLPLAPGTAQSLSGSLRTMVPGECEFANFQLEGVGPGAVGPLVIPAGPTNVSPGIPVCAGTPPSIVADDTYSFTPPEGTQLWRVTLGGFNMANEWFYYSRGSSSPVTFRFPEPSTLAPSRPTPSGQQVGWAPEAYLFSGEFDYDNFELLPKQGYIQVGKQPYGYIRQ